MRKITYRKAIYEALFEEMNRDPHLVLMGEDISVYGGAFGVTSDLWQHFGKDRVIDTPISENSFVGAGIGLALTGMRPVLEIMFMDFITLACDQIINHAAKINYMYNVQLNVPIVIRSPVGAGRGYGASHSQSLERLFIGIPGLKIVSPYTASDAKNMLKAAIKDNNPVIFIEHKLLYNREDVISDNEEIIDLGKAKVLKEGTDITLISYSKMLDLCFEAQDIVKEHGVDVEIVNLRSLKPLDIDTISASVKKTGKVVFVEEGSKTGGVGAEVCAEICENCLEYLNGRVIRVASEDVPIPASVELEKVVLPSVDKVVKAISRSLKW